MTDLRMIRPYARFALGFGNFLRDTLSLEQARTILKNALKNRENNFMHMLERCVYGYSGSPYLPLLKLAGCDLGDIKKMVASEGIEGALCALRNAGVYLSPEEFKCRKPVERGGRVIPIKTGDLDNPLLSSHFQAGTSSSRGSGPILIDLDFLRGEACYHALFLSAFDMADRPMGFWRPLPPGFAGIVNALCHAKVGRHVERWFSQNNIRFRYGDVKYLLFMNFVLFSSRLQGKGFPSPEHVPLSRAVKVARWLHEKCEAGIPALLDTSVSSGLRVCMAARSHGLNIKDTLFRFGGEPYTDSRARFVEETSSRAICHYSMAEVGRIGLACASPGNIDEVHILADKLAVTRHEEHSDGIIAGAGKLDITCILPDSPKIMINVETGDYGTIVERDCGCPLQEFGYHRHLHTIRSDYKITSEGMHFLGSDFHILVEKILPDRFGGNPSNYQFVEESTDGPGKAGIVISPEVGPLDESKVVDTVLECLKRPDGGHRMMSDYWRQAGALTVIRREPYSTYTGKVPPLYIPPK